MGPYYEAVSKELGWMNDAGLSDSLAAKNAEKLQALEAAIAGMWRTSD